MATLLAHLKIKPGKEAAFERIAEEMYRRSHGEEAAVRRYEYWRGAEPGTYYCLESFPDFIGFISHQSSDHHESFDFGSVLADIRLEFVDPVGSASPLTATEHTPLPPDASELERAYYARYPDIRQDWWLDLREAEQR